MKELFTADYAAILIDNFQKFYSKLNLPKLSYKQLFNLVPKAYYYLINLQDPKKANIIPISKPRVDYKIKLKEGAKILNIKAYSLFYNKIITLKVYI